LRLLPPAVYDQQMLTRLKQKSVVRGYFDSFFAKVRKTLLLKFSTTSVSPSNYDPTHTVCVESCKPLVFFKQRIVTQPTPIVVDLLNGMMAVMGNALVLIRSFHCWTL